MLRRSQVTDGTHEFHNRVSSVGEHQIGGDLCGPSGVLPKHSTEPFAGTCRAARSSVVREAKTPVSDSVERLGRTLCESATRAGICVINTRRFSSFRRILYPPGPLTGSDGAGVSSHFRLKA